MTQDSFERAYTIDNKMRKISSMLEKIKREFPEWEYDAEAKEIGDEVKKVLMHRYNALSDEFSSL